MKQCDNWFSGNIPRPVAAAPAPQSEPVAAVPVEPAPAPEAAPKSGVRPYVFGTVGASRDGLKTNSGSVNNRDTQVASQVGAGVQFNEWLGGEVFYQSGRMHKFTSEAGSTDKVRNQTFGGRVIAGTKVADKARVFAKAGVAGVKHNDSNWLSGKANTRPTAGVGATYDVNDSLSVRADYDHYFRRPTNNAGKWKTWASARNTNSNFRNEGKNRSGKGRPVFYFSDGMGFAEKLKKARIFALIKNTCLNAV
ncbi:hypothetical protein BG910_02890 [Neisseria chenwenguii]|uniref:Outer membrane protein beta-barrel domain-containing protein n=1 Tax=Neisseria chenwenguii TaxID=1853278 RepID=A0A220S0T5_9NEIS|nr:outer membrane beta-barrel protein [Neisseria chenwenguii]ASK26825.1 hypothetical protein BG910_02890 [Neisseria chenwenguii]